MDPHVRAILRRFNGILSNIRYLERHLISIRSDIDDRRLSRGRRAQAAILNRDVSRMLAANVRAREEMTHVREHARIYELQRAGEWCTCANPMTAYQPHALDISVGF